MSLHTILSLMTPAIPASGVPHVATAYTSSAPTYPGQPTASADGAAHGTLTLARSASVLGYCLLPLVATSLVGIVMPMDKPLGIIHTTAAIIWVCYF